MTHHVLASGRIAADFERAFSIITGGGMAKETLSATKVGIAVDCAVCHRRKKPTGRSAALEMASSLCDHECPGYGQEPLPGSLWPGESEADFGYPVGTVGTKESAIK